jgi:hypothetical protein
MFLANREKKVLHRDVRSIQALVHSFVNQPKKEKEKKSMFIIIQSRAK